MSRPITLKDEEAQALHVLFADRHLQTLAMFRGLSERTTAILEELRKRVLEGIIEPDGGTQTLFLVQVSDSEAECLEVKVLGDWDEIVVVRHGMDRPESGEAVYSELLHYPPES